jgi:hypothetical protein
MTMTELSVRQRLAQKPRTVDVMKNARLARSAYQAHLLQQFMKFLVSCRPFARLDSILGRTELRVEASARN